MITSWYCIFTFLLVMLPFFSQWFTGSLALSSHSFCCEEKYVNWGEEIFSHSPFSWRQRGEDWLSQLFSSQHADFITSNHILANMTMSSWPPCQCTWQGTKLFALHVVVTSNTGVWSAHRNSHCIILFLHLKEMGIICQLIVVITGGSHASLFTVATCWR